jgi:hypothetical protein
MGYIFLGITIVLAELLRKRRSLYDALVLLNATYFVYFVVAPLHVIVGGGDFVRELFDSATDSRCDFSIGIVSRLEQYGMAFENPGHSRACALSISTQD